MSECRLFESESRIDAYLTGELSQEEMEKFEKHLTGCNTCFQELEFRSEVVGLIREEGKTLFVDYLEKQKIRTASEEPSIFEKLNPLNWHWEPRWVYSGIAAGALAFFVFFLISPFGEKGLDTKQMLAANFEPSPFLEEMVADVSRSYDFTVISPQNEQNFKKAENIVFKWEATEEEVEYLKILNNNGEEIYGWQPENNQLSFTENLSPGLYYWKLESEDDLLYMGKFFLNKPE